MNGLDFGQIVGVSMISPNDFWLCLHRLAESYSSEGLTPDERSQNIVARFCEMPLLAQRQVMADLLIVITNCPDLYPVIATAAAKSEDAAKNPRQAGSA